MSALRETYAYFKRRGFLLLAGFTVVILALYIGELVDSPDFSVPESKYEIRPDIPEIEIGQSIEFELVDKSTGSSVQATFEIVTPHNVPGDRGKFVENIYTAPRWLTHERYVTFQATARESREFVTYVVEVFKYNWPRAGEDLKPGMSHLQPQHRPTFLPPIDDGLKLGASTRLIIGDGFGGEALIAYYQVEHQNTAVEYAGTISSDGVYTAPDVLPDPPEIRLIAVYYREGGGPGDTSLIGPSITLKR